MKIARTLLLLFFSISVLIACKNESTSSDENAPSTKAQNEKTDLSKKEQAQVNSVLTKLMVTPELKTFTSATVTAGIAEMLQKEEGPFTIIAPSNAAFAALPKEQLAALLDPGNKEALVTLLKNHIIKESFSSAALTKSIRNGAETLTTLGGAELVLYKEGAQMILKDSNGATATVGKSDILGSNGVVHVISGVLTATK